MPITSILYTFKYTVIKRAAMKKNETSKKVKIKNERYLGKEQFLIINDCIKVTKYGF